MPFKEVVALPLAQQQMQPILDENQI